MNRQERRERRRLATRRAGRLSKISGMQCGTTFERHRQKIEQNGFGYCAKHGVLLHYVQGIRRSVKTRNRRSYSGTNNWKVRDRRQLLRKGDWDGDL